MVEHTPTPWKAIDGVVYAMTSPKPHKPAVCDCQTSIDDLADADDEDCANAEFIVRCCNCHAELVAALKSFVDYYDQAGISDCVDDEPPDGFDGDEVFNVRMARAALARAKGT